MEGKIFVELLAESNSIEDKFLCIKGDSLGTVVYWDKHTGVLSMEDGLRVNIVFGKSNNEWILVKN